ncbi:Sulfate permease 2 [Ascosphaera pollenicola]|nr:Sulfate permease 2 [Ascosphaera pollenicola]
MSIQISTVPAGTPLKGINYFANKPDPVALPDEEYPNWLWNLVLDHKVASTTANGVNIAEMTKKQRKRHMKKMAALAAEQPKIIPLHEQSIDITPADIPLTTEAEALKAAAESLEQRTDIRKSARAARRKAIREANFLRGM